MTNYKYYWIKKKKNHNKIQISSKKKILKQFQKVLKQYSENDFTQVFPS